MKVERRAAACLLSIAIVASGCGGSLRAVSDTWTDAEDSAVDSSGDAADPDVPEDYVPPDTGPEVEDVPPDSMDTSADLPADTLPDVPPDGPCVNMGCAINAADPCCAGLVPASDCLPGGPPCPGDLLWCILCGDGACSPHENAFDCPGDCPAGCDEGASQSYGCTPIETQVCTCAPDSCTPTCEMGPQWVDPCTGSPIPGTGDPPCFPFGELACLHVGTDAEGWYDVQWEGEAIVRPGACQPRWSCEVVY